MQAAMALAEPPPTLKTISPEHLRDVLDAHRLWVESNGEQGSRANLRGFDLRGRNLQQAVLAGAQLRGVDLSNADCAAADLRAADLSDATLTGTRLARAVLIEANFSRAEMARADLRGAMAASANFSFALMEAAEAADADFTQCNMRDANLRQVSFKQANLVAASLKGAQLQASVFSSTNLCEADLRNAQCNNAVFENSRVEGANFKGADLDGVDLSRTDFTQAYDIAEEYRMRSLEVAQVRLVGEREMLDQLRAGLEAVQRNMLRDKVLMADWKNQENRFVQQVERHSRWLRHYSIAWCGVASVFTLVTLYQVSGIASADLRIAELLMVLAFIGGICALFIFTALRVGAVSRAVRRYDGFCRESAGALLARYHSAIQPTRERQSP